MTRKRITFTTDEHGFIHRACADGDVDVYIVCPHTPRDRVYLWSSTRIGKEHVDDEIDGWPVGDKDHMPTCHWARGGSLRAASLPGCCSQSGDGRGVTAVTPVRNGGKEAVLTRADPAMRPRKGQRRGSAAEAAAE